MSARAHDVLCVGLLCADLVLSVPAHPGADEKLRATSRLLAPGGPAAVAAAQIARLGGRAAFAGLVGEDPFAPPLRAALAAEGIDASALLGLPGHDTPLAAILVKPDAARAVVSHRPAPAAPPPAPAFPRARVVLTDGHRPEWNAALIAHARATAAPLVLDAGSLTESTRELAAAADHVVASEAFATAVLGEKPTSTAASAEALHQALRLGPDIRVVVTFGERGLAWRSPHGGGALPAFPVAAIDTTGAGDAFHGAYALGVARGLALPDVLRLASAAGALACARVGAWAAPATEAEIARLLALP